MYVKYRKHFPYIQHLDDETGEPVTPYESDFVGEARELESWENWRIDYLWHTGDITRKTRDEFKSFLSHLPLKPDTPRDSDEHDDSDN